MAKSRTYLNLETINEDGSVPESRLSDAIAISQIVQQLIKGDEKRRKVDATVYGLFSGNPPYRSSVLRENGQAWRHNINWRIAEAFLNVALTSYWDVIAEAPTKCSVRTDYGTPDEREDWSGIITEEFERLNQEDASLNYMFRLSHHDMVLFRCGPVMFDDAWNYKARPIKQSRLLVEDGVQSNVNDWPLAVIRVDYQADELYAFIRNPQQAAQIGYNVPFVRKTLLDHVDDAFWGKNTRYDWEFYEQRIRNNDLYLSKISKTIPVAHVFYREFPKEGDCSGRISHCMVLESNETDQFLFRRVGRFANWRQVVHPFYYDTGDGTHHSVKGLGIKAYGALEAYNRMECHAADVAVMSSAMHWQAPDISSMQNASVVPMGPFMVHPPGLNLLEVRTATQLEGLIAIKQDLIGTVTSNLSQYRQDVARRRKGAEPPTARQINYEAENETVIGRSGMTWYFEQGDAFYSERFRRASSPNLTDTVPGGKEALAFQKRCLDRGVAKEALIKIESVRMTRTVGYGSADNRMQAMTRLLGRLPLYNEAGRQKILEDITRMDVGEATMRRYIQKDEDSPYTADQRAEATQWVGHMKNGIAPVISPTQNPVIYATIWLQSAAQSAESLSKGANPMEVYSFLEVAGPAIRQQLDRFGQDPTRLQLFKQMDAQWQKLSSLHDQLASQLQAQAQKQAQLRQQSQQINSDLDLKRMESAGKLAISREKQQKNLELKQEVHDQRMAHTAAQTRQQLAINDVTTAASIRNEAVKTKAASAKRK